MDYVIDTQGFTVHALTPRVRHRVSGLQGTDKQYCITKLGTSRSGNAPIV
jgi:hypothetical protein